MIRMVTILLVVTLSACESTVRHTTSMTDVNGMPISTAANYTQKTHRASLIERTRQQCYAAIVQIESDKAKTNPALMSLIERKNVSEMTLIMVAQMIENKQLMASIVDSKPPIECDGMNYYEYATASKKAAYSFWGKLAGNVLKYGTGVFLGKEIIDGLARDTVSAGANSTIVGDNTNYSVDNSDNRDLSTVDSSDNSVSSANSEAGAGDLIDSPEVSPETQIDETVETTTETAEVVE